MWKEGGVGGVGGERRCEVDGRREIQGGIEGELTAAVGASNTLE